MELIDLEERPKEPNCEPVPQKDSQDKGKKGKKDNMTSLAPKTQASQAKVSTHSATKAATKASVAPTTIGVGSPSTTPSMIVAIPS